MNYVFTIIVIFTLIDIESKLSKLLPDERRNAKKGQSALAFKEYLEKEVSISVDNDDLSDIYLFTAGNSVVGKIVDFDEEWLIFEYREKNKKVLRYFRIRDIVGIEETKSASKPKKAK